MRGMDFTTSIQREGQLLRSVGFIARQRSVAVFEVMSHIPYILA